MDLATNLLTMSPTTIPRNPPSGLLRAVAPYGWSAQSHVETFSEAEGNQLERRGLNRLHSPTRGTSGRIVMPEGPAAAPRLALRKQSKNSSTSSWNGSSGSTSTLPVAKAVSSLICQSSQSGEVSWGQRCSFAADNSPTCTNDMGARSPCGLVGTIRLLALTQLALSFRRAIQSPFWNCLMRPSYLRETTPPLAGRNRNILSSFAVPLNSVQDLLHRDPDRCSEHSPQDNWN